MATPQRLFSKENNNEGGEAPKKRGRKKKAEVSEQTKLEAETAPEEAKAQEGSEEKEVGVEQPIKMYTLKFNSPILPYAKFPLTQNKYIQDFLKRYEEDQESIDRVIGVHFAENSNLNAERSVGIEVQIHKRNGITYVESYSDKRFKIESFDETTNFSQAIELTEEGLEQIEGKETTI